jgi:Ca2+-binding EF-hand superfamily protein
VDVEYINRVEKTFNTIDANKSDGLSVRELIGLLKSSGLTETEACWQAVVMFDELNLDRDTKVSHSFLISWFNKTHANCR